ncbi:MAG: gfo/Idh/MocA family oxidoreductase [Bacteroidetes bacterium]|nr:MAG: gfo/Idh/MocA family oxidoreductase [Bacteroidota bacterium]
MKKIRWGIIAPGKIAHEFAHDFQFVKYGELKAVASRSQERADNFAARYGIPKAYGSYAELYADKEIDAIYVATPHTFHHENSTDALNSGKAVLCEKPITVNTAECDSLIALAKEKNQYLMEGMWTYFLPAIQKASEWINTGRIGRVLSIKADFGNAVPFDAESRMYNPALSGGTLLDMGIYPLAITWLIYKKDPINISVISRKASTGVDNDVNMQFEYEDEVASLHSSFRSKLNNHAYIIGEKGYVDLPDFWHAHECLLCDNSDKVIDRFEDNRKGVGFEFEIDSVSHDILNGLKQSEVMPLAYSRKLQEHMQMVMEKF